jgi:hypothetical protein
MPIIDTDMTLEEAEQQLAVAPRGRYTLELTGFKVGEDGSAERTFASGNTGLTAMLRIAEGEQRGKLIKPYNAVKGTGLMAAFKAAFPKANVGRGFDTDVAVGMKCLADVKISVYEGLESNEVQRLYPLSE